MSEGGQFLLSLDIKGETDFPTVRRFLQGAAQHWKFCERVQGAGGDDSCTSGVSKAFG
jgi:hypothetical protein